MEFQIQKKKPALKKIDRENSKFDYLSAAKRPGIKNKLRIYRINNTGSCK